jgi:exopolysaccharide biosynthesis predicted pyruvyltransferase EpsI
MTASPRELADTLRDTLNAEIPSGAHVALLDYPNHENVGDSAIWLGEMTYLAERKSPVAYHCDLKSYDARHLRRMPDMDLLLLHGGGNLGDLWQPHQRFRSQVLADFRDRPVLQLPQTIHFNNTEILEQTKRDFASHPQFTLMVRDLRSLEFAREHFDCPSVLCPDSAFALGEMVRPRQARAPILWLGRTDHEAADHAGQPYVTSHEVERADWVGRRSAGPVDLLGRAGGELLAGALGKLSAHPPGALELLWAQWKRLALHRVQAGQEMLSRGTVVVTDRLHAHILCMLLGIPHVVMDNSYGKLSSYSRTWDTLGDRAQWADSPSQAMALARELSV